MALPPERGVHPGARKIEALLVARENPWDHDPHEKKAKKNEYIERYAVLVEYLGARGNKNATK